MMLWINKFYDFHLYYLRYPTENKKIKLKNSKIKKVRILGQ